MLKAFSIIKSYKIEKKYLNILNWKKFICIILLYLYDQNKYLYIEKFEMKYKKIIYVYHIYKFMIYSVNLII